MLKDFVGVLVVHQGVDAVARSVFDLEFAAYAVGQGLVGHDAVAQFAQAFKDVPVGSGERRAAFGIGGVQQGAVRHDHAGGEHGFVRVVGSATAHAAGVVGKDAADKAAVDGGRVRADFFAEFRKNLVGSRADNAGLKGNFFRPFAYPPVFPALADAHEHGVRHGLAGKAGSRSAKCHGHIKAVGNAHKLYDLCFIQNVHHYLGRKAVNARVRAVGKKAQRVGVYTIFGNEFLNGVIEFFIGCCQH